MIEQSVQNGRWARAQEAYAHIGVIVRSDYADHATQQRATKQRTTL